MATDETMVLNSQIAVEQFRELARQAATVIPYYQRSFASVDFSQPYLPPEALPVLTKETARQVQNELVQPDISHKQINREIGYTSGSTGIPIRIIRQRTERLRAAKTLWKARQAIFPDIFSTRGVTISNRLYTAPLVHELNMRLHGKAGMMIETTFDYNLEQVGQFLDELDYHQPRWLAGQPAHLSLLAHYIRSKNRPPKTSLAFVESRGTLLTENTRALLEETFQCPVVNHYGCEETLTIAYECPKGRMHLFNDCVLVELLPLESPHSYEIVITSLIFKIMPFIRYILGDIVDYKPVQCACGNPHAVLGSIQGRINELIAGTALNGPHVFDLVMEHVIATLGLNIVLQYQVHQVTLHNFEVHVILSDPSLISHVSSIFQQAVAGVLPRAQFLFRPVHQINPSSGGKLQPFVWHI